MPVEPIPGMHPGDTQPVPVSFEALQLFFYHILQHLLIQTQVGNQLFELGIFFFQLMKTTQLGDAQSAIFLLPVEKSRL